MHLIGRHSTRIGSLTSVLFSERRGEQRQYRSGVDDTPRTVREERREPRRDAVPRVTERETGEVRRPFSSEENASRSRSVQNETAKIGEYAVEKMVRVFSNFRCRIPYTLRSALVCSSPGKLVRGTVELRPFQWQGLFRQGQFVGPLPGTSAGEQQVVLLLLQIIQTMIQEAHTPKHRTGSLPRTSRQRESAGRRATATE